MTVRELIAALQEMPQEYQVAVHVGHDGPGYLNTDAIGQDALRELVRLYAQYETESGEGK